jgi:hypothetical protein
MCLENVAETHLGATHTHFVAIVHILQWAPWDGLGAHYKPKMCTTWAQGVSGHHQSFLRNRWIGPRADRGKKREESLP